MGFPLEGGEKKASRGELTDMFLAEAVSGELYCEKLTENWSYPPLYPY